MTWSQDESRAPRRKRWLSLSVASLASLLVSADSGQLSIALPAIISEFNSDLTLDRRGLRADHGLSLFTLWEIV
jgi:hypothetical protein